MRDTRYETGSALIMTVVITVLLAVMGIMFVLSARVDKIATSYISENRELYAAVDTVIEDICRQLIDDVPGVNDVASQEYYDYPGNNDRWLASLEPYEDSSNNYYWWHITDLYGGLDARDVKIEIVPDCDEIDVEDPNDEHSDLSDEQLADADGDGVSDSKWVRLNDMMTSKGRPIFAAVRIIDNGGMLNVNTGYKFDPNATDPNRVDGSSLTQIDLLTLSERDDDLSAQQAIDKLWDYRCGPYESNDLSLYERNVVWRYNEPSGLYTPFDISDELKLRYRYILNYRPINTRIEELWDDAYDRPPGVPRDSNSQLRDKWFYHANNSSPDINDYDYRHISTTYNMDRIINPSGQEEMLNVNNASADKIFGAVRAALLDADPNFADANDEAAQIAVNLVDFRDGDENVTVYPNPDDGKTYYGFERPCVYISELAHHFKTVFEPGGVGTEPGLPYRTQRSYAIELHKPYSEDIYPEPNQWRLSLPGYAESPVNIDWSGTPHFHVIYFEDPCVPLVVDFNDPNFTEQNTPFKRYSEVFKFGDLIELQRLVGDVNDPNSEWITVDAVPVPDESIVSGWLQSDANGIMRSIPRNITLHKCIRRLWASGAEAGDPTLCKGNNYLGGSPEKIQAHPANRFFTNLGEIGSLFREDVYGRAWSGTDTEADVRVDLTDPNYQRLFNYLTVFDSSVDGINNDGDGITQDNPEGWVDSDDEIEPNTPEWKIPGRININTAPWFVIAQLPWIRYSAGMDNYDDLARYGRARMICEYRDRVGAYSGREGEEGFRSIGELMNVDEMLELYTDTADNWNGDGPKGPDLTQDNAQDDFEERDLLFTRLSNLVTVRSDVFTAYILVRIGTDGPQKRVIAILDRSDVYPDGGDVKIVAWHPVADPR